MIFDPLPATAWRKIAEVEGIRPSSEALARSVEFDRLGLSAEQRRRAIIDSYERKISAHPPHKR